MKSLSITLLFFIVTVCACAQSDSLIKIVQKHPIISTGGADLIPFNQETFIVGVGFVEIKGQSRSILERVGKIKAEKEIAILINGSDFTSSAKVILEQIVTVTDGNRVIKNNTNYLQYIKENSEGFIHSMTKLSTWKSDDNSMFYYSIYKPLNIN